MSARGSERSKYLEIILEFLIFLFYLWFENRRFENQRFKYKGRFKYKFCVTKTWTLKQDLWRYMLVTKNKGLSFRNADFVRSIQLPFEIQDIESCAPTWSFFAFVELFTTRTVKKDQHEKQRIGAARIFFLRNTEMSQKSF